MDNEELFQQRLTFKVIKNFTDYYTPNQCQYVNKNQTWRSAYLQKQVILLGLEEMSNIRYMTIDNFEFGCEMSVYISEYQSGPFIPIHENKYFCRNKNKKVPLCSLPCRFIKIIVTKGTHINISKLGLIGSLSEELATDTDNYEIFKLMVTNPQRIMYE